MTVTRILTGKMPKLLICPRLATAMRSSQHEQAKEAQDDQSGEDGEDAFFLFGGGEGHGRQRPMAARLVKISRTSGSPASSAQSRLLDTRTKNWSPCLRKPYCSAM